MNLENFITKNYMSIGSIFFLAAKISIFADKEKMGKNEINIMNRIEKVGSLLGSAISILWIAKKIAGHLASISSGKGSYAGIENFNGALLASGFFLTTISRFIPNIRIANKQNAEILGTSGMGVAILGIVYSLVNNILHSKDIREI